MTEKLIECPQTWEPESKARLHCGHMHTFTKLQSFNCRYCDQHFEVLGGVSFEMRCYKHAKATAIRYCLTHLLALCQECIEEHGPCDIVRRYESKDEMSSDRLKCCRHANHLAVKLCVAHLTAFCVSCHPLHMQCECLIDLSRSSHEDFQLMAKSLDLSLSAAESERRKVISNSKQASFDDLCDAVTFFLSQPAGPDPPFSAMCESCRLRFDSCERRPSVPMACGHANCEVCFSNTENVCAQCAQPPGEQIVEDSLLLFKISKRSIDCSFHLYRGAVSYCDTHRKPLCFQCSLVHFSCTVIDILRTDLFDIVKEQLKVAKQEVKGVIQVREDSRAETTFHQVLQTLQYIDSNIKCSRHNVPASFFHLQELRYGCQFCDGNKIDLNTYRKSTSVDKKLVDRIVAKLRKLTAVDLGQGLLPIVQKRKTLEKGEIMNLAYQLGRVKHSPAGGLKCLKCNSTSKQLKLLPCKPGPHVVCGLCVNSEFYLHDRFTCPLDKCDFFTPAAELSEYREQQGLEEMTCLHCETLFHPTTHQPVSLVCGHLSCSNQQSHDFCALCDCAVSKVESVESPAAQLIEKLINLRAFCSIDGVKPARYYCENNKKMLCADCAPLHSGCTHYDILVTDVKAIILRQANSITALDEWQPLKDAMPQHKTLMSLFHDFERLLESETFYCKTHSQRYILAMDLETSALGCQQCTALEPAKYLLIDNQTAGERLWQLLVTKVRKMNFWEFTEEMTEKIHQVKSTKDIALILNKLAHSPAFVAERLRCHSQYEPTRKFVRFSCGTSATHAICLDCAQMKRFRMSPDSFQCPWDALVTTYQNWVTFQYCESPQPCAKSAEFQQVPFSDGIPLPAPQVFDATCLWRFNSVLPMLGVQTAAVDERTKPWVISAEKEYVETFTFWVRCEVLMVGLTLACPIVPSDQYSIERAEIRRGESTISPVEHKLQFKTNTVTQERPTQVAVDLRFVDSVRLEPVSVYTLVLRLVPMYKREMLLFTGNFMCAPKTLQADCIQLNFRQTQLNEKEQISGNPASSPILRLFFQSLETLDSIPPYCEPAEPAEPEEPLALKRRYS